jgi:hypothetical protein
MIDHRPTARQAAPIDACAASRHAPLGASRALSPRRRGASSPPPDCAQQHASGLAWPGQARWPPAPMTRALVLPHCSRRPARLSALGPNHTSSGSFGGGHTALSHSTLGPSLLPPFPLLGQPWVSRQSPKPSSASEKVSPRSNQTYAQCAPPPAVQQRCVAPRCLMLHGPNQGGDGSGGGARTTGARAAAPPTHTNVMKSPPDFIAADTCYFVPAGWPGVGEGRLIQSTSARPSQCLPGAPHGGGRRCRPRMQRSLSRTNASSSIGQPSALVGFGRPAAGVN